MNADQDAGELQTPVCASVEYRDAQLKALTILSPFILTANLLLLLRGEVVGDIEGLANFLRRLALDHVGNSLAADIEKRLDVEVVGCLQHVSVQKLEPGELKARNGAPR